MKMDVKRWKILYVILCDNNISFIYLKFLDKRN